MQLVIRVRMSRTFNRRHVRHSSQVILSSFRPYLIRVNRVLKHRHTPLMTSLLNLGAKKFRQINVLLKMDINRLVRVRSKHRILFNFI